MSTETPETNANCPFCEWLHRNGDKPPTVYEDEHLVATLCDVPISQGHTQIIFKTHYHELAAVDPEDSARMGALIPLISGAIKNALGAEMVYVACIAEVVRHIHFHLVPRYQGSVKGFDLLAGPRIPLERVEETLAALKEHLRTKSTLSMQCQ